MGSEWSRMKGRKICHFTVDGDKIPESFKLNTYHESFKNFIDKSIIAYISDYFGVDVYDIDTFSISFDYDIYGVGFPTQRGTIDISIDGTYYKFLIKEVRCKWVMRPYYMVANNEGDNVNAYKIYEIKN